jgi:hypothetical protein
MGVIMVYKPTFTSLGGPILLIQKFQGPILYKRIVGACRGDPRGLINTILGADHHASASGATGSSSTW